MNLGAYNACAVFNVDGITLYLKITEAIIIPSNDKAGDAPAAVDIDDVVANRSGRARNSGAVVGSNNAIDRRLAAKAAGV